MDLEDILTVLLSMNEDDEQKEIVVDIYDDFFIIEAQRTQTCVRFFLVDYLLIN